jgi:hypothetical protein
VLTSRAFLASAYCSWETLNLMITAGAFSGILHASLTSYEQTKDYTWVHALNPISKCFFDSPAEKDTLKS